MKLSKILKEIEVMRKTSFIDDDGKLVKVGGKAKAESTRLEADTPAEVLVGTVLAMRQRWEETAKKQVENFQKSFSNVKNLRQLKRLMNSQTEEEFCKDVLRFTIRKKNNWRYLMLRDLVRAFSAYKKRLGFKSDWRAMKHWARNVNLSYLEEDPIGEIGNVGLATVQNMRLELGIDTSKPDVHVKNVLKHLGLGHDVGVIELLSEVSNIRSVELDQVFWYWDKYGKKSPSR